MVAAWAAFGADVAGKWKAVYEGQNGSHEVTFTFQVTGEKLTGTASGPQGDMAITEGKVDGDKISFTVERDQFKAVFSGTVSGDDLKLSGSTGERTFDLPAKRIKQ